MTRKEAIIHLWILLIALVGTPLISWFVGLGSAAIFALVCFAVFTYWPTQKRY